MNIAFIGLGKFGQAIASLVEYNGLEYDYAEAAESRLLSKPADLVFLMVPAQFMRQAIKDNKQFIPDQAIIVNGTKGIEEKTHLMVHQIVRSLGRYPNYYSLIGPSFAEGIIDRHPTVVSLGYKNAEHLEIIKKTLETPYFKVRESRGYRALELASALKNLYAILCGYSQGLGFGPNTQAQLVTLALGEFRQLAKAMKFADYDVMAPGVVGDLVLTCGSEQSRNFQYGLQLAKTGDSKPEKPKTTIEGYHTSHSINAIAKECGVKLPLAALTSRIINNEITNKEAFRNFLAAY
jgi:glycerol-3-phosphate dehydrogenase (NAD(P)+)